jgi:hypothetical protein
VETALVLCISFMDFIVDSVTHDSIAFHFPTQGADINQYSVNLQPQYGGTHLQTATYNQSTGTVYHTFSGLTPNTNYEVHVVSMIAGKTGASCQMLSTTTLAAPSTCAPPTGVSATLTKDAPPAESPPAPGYPGLSIARYSVILTSDSLVEVTWRYYTDGNVPLPGDARFAVFMMNEGDPTRHFQEWVNMTAGSTEMFRTVTYGRPVAGQPTQRTYWVIDDVSGYAVLGMNPSDYADLPPQT